MQAFWSRDHGQDLVEYSLILALVALLGAAGILAVGQDVSAIWSLVNSRLTDTSSSS